MPRYKKIILSNEDIEDYQAAIKAQKESASRNYCERQQFMSPEEEQKELCKLATWSDQIMLRSIVCYECKKTVCECDSKTLEQLTIRTKAKVYSKKEKRYVTVPVERLSTRKPKKSEKVA